MPVQTLAIINANKKPMQNMGSKKYMTMRYCQAPSIKPT
jgi:hypothetical protein